MIHNPKMYRTMPLGIVLQKAPGVTRWVPWVWRAVGVLPGAGAAAFREIRKDGDVTDYHAATLTLELHGAETEAYLHGLRAQVPCVYVVMREGEGDCPFDMVLVTASPYEAQDYADSGEEQIEKIAMPPALLNWVTEFVEEFHVEEEFKKRRRDKKRTDLSEDGIGDARIAQMADVYRSPAARKKARLQ